MPSQGSAVKLAEILDVKAAGPLLAEFLMRRGSSVEIDASEVRVMGAQCLQVILSARNTWDRDGLSMRIADPSSAFLRALETAGLSSGALNDRE